MKVALHTGQLLQAVPGGIGRYVSHLLHALPEVGVEAAPFAAGPAPTDLEGYVDLGRPGGSVRYELWHRLRQPVIRVDGDLVHAPSLAVPPPGRRPLVVTVHDLVFLRQPEHLTPRGVAFHRRGLELARRHAAAIVVPSRFVAGDLASEGFAPERIHVAPHGVELGAAPSPELAADRRARLGVRAPYLLFVGTIEPRKGVPDLLTAHAALRRSHPDLALVLAGRPGWGPPPMVDRPGVTALGHTDDADLDALYRGAMAFVLPSRYEGFGMPVLEAMVRDCPVVTTDVASLPEVAGGAAELVSPGDVDELTSTLDALVVDEDRRRDMAEAGRRHAAAFTWQRSARAHADAYAAALALARS